MSVHRLHSDADDRITALKVRHAAELDRAYRQGVDTALLYVGIALALIAFWIAMFWMIILPLAHWLAS